MGEAVPVIRRVVPTKLNYFQTMRKDWVSHMLGLADSFFLMRA